MNIGIACDIRQIQKRDLDISVLNIENPLYPNYLEQEINHDIKTFNSFDYTGKVIIDGAYIDLNPGSPEKIIQEITKKKVIESIHYAKAIKAHEIIFLSTFLPMIKVDFYDENWLNQSIRFWRDITNTIGDIRISLCNTFEEEPNFLLKIVNEVNSNHFGLAFDIGHALLYGKITLSSWYKQIESYVKTIYLHSNDKKGDLHMNLDEGVLLTDSDFLNFAKELKTKNLIIKTFDKSRINENFKLLNKELSK